MRVYAKKVWHALFPRKDIKQRVNPYPDYKDIFSIPVSKCKQHWWFLLYFLQGEIPKNRCPACNIRFYSIASTRYGDSFDGRTASLCVRRAVHYDREIGDEDPSKKGICSNFLCDSKPGDKIQLVGKGFSQSEHCDTVENSLLTIGVHIGVLFLIMLPS